MRRDSLDFTLVVVTDTKGAEFELQLADVGNLSTETSQALVIGQAVRRALLLAGDGDAVEVRVYSR